MKGGLASESLRKAGARVAIVCYSIALFLTLDFGYSAFINNEASPRVAVKEYDHGLVANFDGYARFGEYRYRFYTNSLGFRDNAVRQVPRQSGSRRVILIGDSFVEGMAVTFDESFAGQLAQAGAKAAVPIEFLNAAVVSYSPIIYYRKIKYLIDSGLRFDEVIVFSDPSDVQDEATTYFCLDDDPQYLQYCRDFAPSKSPNLPAQSPVSEEANWSSWFQEHFVVTDSTRMLIKYGIQLVLDNRSHKSADDNPRAGWTIAGYPLGDSFAPLGLEGGIARSKKNMQALADLLRERGIPLTIVVYPWPLHLALEDRNSRQVAIWRDFCRTNCKAFVDLFPAFFRERDTHDDWYKRLFIYGDLHLSVAGNRFMFREVAKQLGFDY